jgi:NADP-dependent 3-hydroxy acid dehydrogenase YdfG
MTLDVAGRTALVTGASQGIGRAISARLAEAGMRVWMVARRPDPLDQAARAISGNVQAFAADLRSSEARGRLVEAIRSEKQGLDLLVNSAGIIHLGRTEDASEEDFNEQLQANVVAPYALTRSLLPLLEGNGGQIVFINSSAGKSSNPGVGQYSATQHAMRSFADSLRSEVNQRGIRVTVVHPGRTATPRQAEIHSFEGRTYQPERLIQPSDVADVVLCAVTLPLSAEVTEIALRPMLKS